LPKEEIKVPKMAACCRVLIFLASRLSKTFADKHPAVPRMFAGSENFWSRTCFPGFIYSSRRFGFSTFCKNAQQKTSTIGQLDQLLS
jgi:hypothetical protein